jgi:hypothetical protein
MELRSVLELMKEFNVCSLKTADYDIKMLVQKNTAPLPAEAVEKITEAAHNEILSKIAHVQSIMSTGDEDLIEQLFPAAEGEDGI